jgi:hypothetical protein
MPPTTTRRGRVNSRLAKVGQKYAGVDKIDGRWRLIVVEGEAR